MRVISQPANRGSQKWLQVAVNEKRDIINAAILNCLAESKSQTISWVSPLKADEYAEYRDEEFLERLNIELTSRPLSSFWPRRGPQWDGLGRAQDGSVFLVEAKAHLSEIQSPPSQAGDASRRWIETSLKEVKSYLGVESDVDWSGLYYQYANRIAHLYLLRELNNIPAYLIFLGFINDREMSGPIMEEEWHASICELETYLGLPSKHKLSDFILHVYLDVSLLG